MESSSTTAMPDTNLLVFILDTLQKKDTYGVFSEPVDSKELPDYHDIVEHPMDFRTVREKLETGAYVKLEQFEKDVFLICSNAMRYNALDTIYFRQARSIEELAKKNFENVRQDSDDNELQQTIVKRGRPPTTNPKKRLGRPPIVRTGSDLSSGATLADAGENNIDLRRGSYEKSGPSETSGRIDHRSCSNDSFTWSSEHTSGGNDEFPASVVKGISVKFGKKLFVLDESRRNTYKQSHLSGRSFPSVLATFRGEKKQLMAVGLHMEHGFARSLARFAASLGPVAWKIASKKIERALPTGVKFGPGWVGENESPLSESLLTIHTPAHLFSEQPFSVSNISSSATVRSIPDVKVDKVSERQVPSNNSASDVYLNRISSPSTAASSLVGNLSSEHTTESVEATRPKLESRDCLLSSNADGIMLNPPFQIHQGPVLNPSVNSFQNLSQMDKVVKPLMPVGSVTSAATVHSELHDAFTKTKNGIVQSISMNEIEAGNMKSPENLKATNSEISFVVPNGEGFQQLSCQDYSQHQKLDSVPPDLNVRLQSPVSSTSTQQSDLALQL